MKTEDAQLPTSHWVNVVKSAQENNELDDKAMAETLSAVFGLPIEYAQEIVIQAKA